jgi:hypothetical protein
MTQEMPRCPVCNQPFSYTPGVRKKKFCSRKCWKKNYRNNPPVPKKVGAPICEICGNEYVRTKRHQRYCSKQCYSVAWIHNNRLKHNTRILARRKAQPEWYRKNESRYYRTYRTKQISSKPWRYLLQSAHLRAKEKGMPFDLTNEWAAARWTGRCEITGLAFLKNAVRGPHPYSPTVDRIAPSKGYTQDNTRFIIWGCNAIKGVGTDADMHRIAKHIVITSLNAVTAEALLSLPV